TEDPKDSRKNALLHGLQYDYQGILDKYAEAVGTASGAVGTTGTTTTTATEDTTATTTVQTGSNADRVFKDVSEALKGLEEKYGADYYTEYFSDFATAVMVKCDASLKGKIKLNLKSRGGTTYDEKTYAPATKPKVQVSAVGKAYGGLTEAADYTWDTTADENGVFEFKECLPSGVNLKITIGSFEEKIKKEGAAEAEAYWFSSASQLIYAESTGSSASSATTTTKTETSSTTGTTTTTVTETVVVNDSSMTSVKLGSKDSNENSYLIMLFAQNDKIAVSKTNLEKNAQSALLETTDALEFTFNKPMKKVSIANNTTTTTISNLNQTEYKAEFSEDRTTVKFSPVVGYWIIKGTGNPTIRLSGEAEDGTTTFFKTVFYPYFDNKVWVNVKEDADEKKNAVSYADYNDRLSLDSSITLVFSKAMNKKVAVKLYDGKTTTTEVTTAYDELWSEDNKELTLTPVKNAKFWELTNDSISIQVDSDYSSSEKNYNNLFGYWKTGAAKITNDNDCLRVYFDNYIDVSFGEKSKDGTSFPINFSKELKDLTETELNDNITIYYGTTYDADGTYTVANKVEDTKFTLSSNDGKSTITVTAKNGDFEKYGYYYVTFKDKVFVAKTGESILRKDATIAKKETTGKTPFVTPFTLGSNFDYVSVTTVKELPPEVVASRAAFASNEEYLKVTFTKEIKKSELKVNGHDVKNYIKGAEVYLPLSEKKLTDNAELKLTGDVTAIDGAKKSYETSPISTYYRLSKSYFKMIKSSLYDEKAAIAGKNDVVNPKINPTDTVTFTFDQDISAANVKWTAELYDDDTVTSRNLDNSLYAAKATASGNVLTVALNEKKALENGTPSKPKVYYLSIKAVNREGDDAVVLFDSDKATLGVSGVNETKTIYYGKVSDGKYLNEKIVTTKTVEQTDYHYIKIQTKEHYVLDVADDSATTKFEDFNKSTKSPIVIEFTQPVAGFKAVLAKKGESWDKYDDIDLTKTYESIVTVDGNKLKITPTYAFPSKEVVDPIVYNAKGEKISLVLASEEFKEGTKKTLFDDTVDSSTGESDPKKCFIAKELKDSTKELTEYLDGVTADSALVLTQFNTAEVGNGMDLYFFFKPIVSQRENSAKYGKYTLYKKVTDATTAATLWKKQGDYCVDKEVTGATALQGVNKDVKATSKFADVTVESATAQDFGVRKLMALISVKADATEFNYSKISEYKLVYTNDNVERYSNTVSVTDAKLNATFNIGDASDANATLTEFKADGSSNETLGTSEVSPTNKVYSVKSTGYMVSGTIVTTAAKTPTATENRINKKNVTGKFNDDRTVFTITIDNSALAAKDDTIVITVTDAQDKNQTFTIQYK
ncbi:MAG: hypothetical protein SPL22_00770, partial [Treponema sp.]|uniref:hypothetical protein n=1 Tax=Treponema sp. TaxID=166 RepID=UPI002A91D8E9